MEAIDAVDQVEQSDRFAAFIGLQVTNHMPTKPVGAEGDLRLRFLDPVFAEDGQPQLRRRPHRFWRLPFADGDQGYRVDPAAGSLASRSQLRPDSVEVCPHVHGELVA